MQSKGLSNFVVSVIIPVYGTEKYIERCVRSLFSQDLDSIQFIFVNDCTPDKSIDVLQGLIEDYRGVIEKRKWEVIVVNNDKNMGLPRTRQQGLKYAKGDYIIHCDSDDWVDSNMYYSMYNKAIEDSSDIVACDILLTDGTSEIKRIRGCSNCDKGAFIDNMMFQKDHWSLCNKLIRSGCYSNVQVPKGGMGEDMALTLQLILNCKKISYVSGVYYYYYQNPESIVHVQSKDYVLDKYYQLSNNSKLLFDIYNNRHYYERFKKGIDWLWFWSSNVLIPYLREKDVYTIWRCHFTGQHISFFLNSNISFLRKVRHLLILIRLYK